MKQESLINLQDDLYKMKTQLDFLFKAFAAFLNNTDDESLQVTDYEAYQGAMLGLEILQKMVKRAEEAFKERPSESS